MPKANGPNESFRSCEQVELVQGDISYPDRFKEEINRKLADGYSLVSVTTVNYAMLAFVVKKQRVKVG